MAATLFPDFCALLSRLSSAFACIQEFNDEGVFQPRRSRRLGVKMSFVLEGAAREDFRCSGGVLGSGEATDCRRSQRMGFCRPSGAGFSRGDGTQRSRAGLLSDGPPGLGPRLGKTRSCRGVSGSNPVLVREFSIPMPIPIPIPTRDARVCRAGSSTAGVVSVRRLRRVRTVSFCDFL
jgi:hypothetical protein